MSGSAAPREGAAPSFRQTERSWLVPTALVVVVAVALGIAGLLLGRSGAGDLLEGVRDVLGGESGDAVSELGLASASAFDPDGDGHENDALADNVRDGDATTSWRTEGYNNRDITRLKSGVGIVVTLTSPATLERLEIDSPTNDWQARVYVADSAAADLAGWGEPVAVTEGLPAGSTTVDLAGAEGGAVLVWIVDRGDAAGRGAAEIQELRVLGR